MIKAIIFVLWANTRHKEYWYFKITSEKFNNPKTDDYLRKYEDVVRLEEWGMEN
jgi:hypothetical protein